MKMRHAVVAMLCCTLVSSAAASAADNVIYVNNQTGSDAFDGRSPAPADGKRGPVATIMAGVAKAAVGGVVSIANTGKDYRESVSIEKFGKGRAATPLVIEGNGAGVTGLLEVPAARWTLEKDDLYYFENKLSDDPPKYGPMPNSNWLGFLKHQGWFPEPQAPRIFFLDGKEAPDSLTLEGIQPGGFFYQTQGKPRRVYFRLPPGGKLADCRIEMPLNTGVFVSDDYVVVRNLASRHSQDDGFAGFWGQAVVFENVNGSFNCDQGISFHGTSSTLIDGGLFERNGGGGIVDVMSCVSVYRRAVSRDNLISGALLQGTAHSMLGCQFFGNAGPQVSVGAGTTTNLTNCLVIGSDANGRRSPGVVMHYGRLDRCTLVRCSVGLQVPQRPGGLGASLRNSIVRDCNVAVSIQPDHLGSFRMANNIIELGVMSIGDQKGKAANWQDFAAANKLGSDNVIDAPELEGPTFLLPKDSVHATAGENKTTPGASVQPYAGWKSLGDAPTTQPSP